MIIHSLEGKQYQVENHPFIEEGEDVSVQDDPVQILRYMVDGLYGIDLDR